MKRRRADRGRVPTGRQAVLAPRVTALTLAVVAVATLAAAAVAAAAPASASASASASPPGTSPGTHSGAAVRATTAAERVAAATSRVATTAAAISRATTGAWYGGTNPPASIPLPGPTTTSALVAAIDAARSAEGVGPLVLPSNWASLDRVDHLAVLVDLERTARGLAPFAGMTATLDAAAQAAAIAGTDPTLGAAGNWAGGTPTSLVTDFAWMYDDGPSSPNLDCPTPTSPGCWGHRDNILDLFTGYPTDGTLELGVGESATSPGGSPSWAVAEDVGPPGQALVFSWASELPALPLCEQTGDTCAGGGGGLARPGSPVVAMASDPTGDGYWLVNAAGQVDAHGGAVSYGGLSGPLDAPVSHIVPTVDGRGYWLVAADGGVFAFGDAPFYGSMGGRPLNAPVVDLAPTADGGGYWLVATDGGVFAFGDAPFRGSMGGRPLNAPVNGITAAGGGYRLVAADGGIFSFGAPFFGSTGSLVLDRPVVGMADSPSGGGYWLVASDGGIFSFGDAAFHGSMGGVPLDQPVVGMAADPATGGYWLVAADGGIFSFDAPFFGSD